MKTLRIALALPLALAAIELGGPGDLGRGTAWAQPQPAPAGGGQAGCDKRYADFFVRLPSVALSAAAADQFRVNAEVKALFGPRPEVCDAAGYGKFIDGFRAFARDAMRGRGKGRDNQLRSAIAALEAAPLHVAADDARGCISAFRQARSDLSATASDVGGKGGPLIQALLDNFERAAAPQPQQVVPEAGPVQKLRIPTSPLPPWVVISLHETLEAQRQKNYDAAQGKLEVVIKWLETAK